MLCLLHNYCILTSLTQQPSISGELEAQIPSLQVLMHYLREKLPHVLLAGKNKIKTVIRNGARVKILVPVISTQGRPCNGCGSTLYEDGTLKHKGNCSKVKILIKKAKKIFKREEEKTVIPKDTVYPRMNIKNGGYD